MTEPHPRPLQPGDVCWSWLAPTVGREQSGRRPVVVVSSAGYLDVVTTLAVVVPVSSRDRGWPNHVVLRGTGASGRTLPRGFALTEQPRTLSRERLDTRLGRVDAACLTEIRRWLADFLDL